MQIGYIKNADGDAVCMNCKTKVGNNGQAQINFCPQCGNPLNLKSAVLREAEVNRGKIAILEELSNELKNDKKTQDLIAEYVESLSKNC